MTTTAPITVLGLGHALGEIIRGNDDPLFDWLRAHPPAGGELFDGLKWRRALPRADDLVGLMCDAARRALADARTAPAEVDMLLGYGSVSAFDAPNDLALVHRELRLPPHCRILPINSDYTNFIDALKLAHDLAQAGTVRRALVACGNNWTHHVDYHEAVAMAASDAAGAAVVGSDDGAAPGGRFEWIDWDSETQPGWYGALHMSPRPSSRHPGTHTRPLMTIDPHRGAEAVKTFGLQVPGTVVARLLARHGLSGADITLVAHQSSRQVETAWQEAIQPACYISTLEDLGDMVSSSVPVNWSHCRDDIRTDYLVLLGIGMEMHATASLYRRR